ncbi:MAG: TOBE domain-containing protein [Candidatus Accumulibacter phosphatis]|uniref:TOBE domain-containing protein n=2 Tax=Candidatus Accumulibacter TaxID=327159 RepID=A0A7D5SBN5_9PROT|nr:MULTISPECIES: TOBE domain-containing protein [Candidatus Accumulibacter]QLH49797.1 MAG: TOBE domain-containing protein [Candidatus Accumulibacter cognatus]MBL8401101.1 TOBE domain-containing protein [Accumulibacter sp.]MBN8519628.1 TOBE domain-containing protein [Accumulibacter sp.]MBO3709234.1 TOBE domain-containing protein [Accumulibacter sp.]MCC2866389.1 TOBE domain-containing protein [Candidatus Accumulibacter phosphatis]
MASAARSPLVSMLTNDSVAELGLHEGVRACALIKASHIILAVPA